jgi:hypothetical protein
VYAHIFNKRVQMLCRRSLSLSLREYFVDQMVVVVVRRALSPSLYYSLSLALLIFFSDKFRVLKSKALSRHVSPPLSSVFLRGEPILLYFSRATRTHARTHKTKKKMQSTIAQRASAFARAPRMTRQVRKRDSNLFLVGTEKEGRALFSPD